MGAPDSPYWAELVFEYLECVALENLRNKGIQLAFYKRFKDDIALAANPTDTETIINEFNAFDGQKMLKFMCEDENEGSLAFLNTKGIRSPDGVLKFK